MAPCGCVASVGEGLGTRVTVSLRRGGTDVCGMAPCEAILKNMSKTGSGASDAQALLQSLPSEGGEGRGTVLEGRAEPEMAQMSDSNV